MTGRARVFGDDINTDYIITSRRKRESLDPAVLRLYLFETLDPGFADSVRPGDVIVAGRNFGCGSAMEGAVTAKAGTGNGAVLARSYSRTYYRNAVNNGLMPVVCDTSAIREGDWLDMTESACAISPPASCWRRRRCPTSCAGSSRRAAWPATFEARQGKERAGPYIRKHAR